MASSYLPNYFSLEDIIVTQERIPCTVETTLSKMGFLDPSSTDDDLKVGSKLELPLWYTVQFDNSRSRYLKLELPDIYKKTFKDICEADATAVDLGRMNKHFYELGRYMARFDRFGVIGPMLFDTCRHRIRFIMDLCKGDLNDLKNETKLEHIEMCLYTEGWKTSQKYLSWLSEDTAPIQMGTLVSNHQKRKRAEMDGNTSIDSPPSKYPSTSI